jgi:hypothetical protein
VSEESGVSGRTVAIVTAVVIAVIGALIGGRIGLRMFLFGVRRARVGVRFAFRVATLTLYRRCTDCGRMIPVDARVCWRCGYRA